MLRCRSILLAAVAGLALTAMVFAAPPDQKQLKANLAKKLAQPFVKSGGWGLDYNDARATAKASKKLLFVYFTRTFAP